jgi:hypothetical protein
MWDASFRDVERVLGRDLPTSAYKYQAWWANQNGARHSQTHGWRSVGWRTAKLDLERKRVRFERERPDGGSLAASAGDTPRSGPGDPNVDLVARAMAISGIEDREEVVAAALRAFIRSETVRFAEELGGSAPGFQAAPRERPWG